MLATRPNGKWSAKDHLGHLVDLQPLDEQRLHELLARTPALSTADICNRATEPENHHQAPVAHILGRLRIGREELVVKLDALTAEEAGISAVHPRLQKPMRMLDWLYFVAEHDDHHLAKARRAILRGDRRWSGDRGEQSQIRRDAAARTSASQLQSRLLRRNHEHLQTQWPPTHRRPLVESKKVRRACRISRICDDYRMNNSAHKPSR